MGGTGDRSDGGDVGDMREKKCYYCSTKKNNER